QLLKSPEIAGIRARSCCDAVLITRASFTSPPVYRLPVSTSCSVFCLFVTQLGVRYLLMDKSWINTLRLSPEYMTGLESFLNFAFSNNNDGGQIVCPCPKCGFKKWLCRDDVYEHLLRKPFPPGYTVWDRHGKRLYGSSSRTAHTIVQGSDHIRSLHSMVNDAFGVVTEEVRETT
ncbi:hypothetical protein LINPERHAP1_LOCUS152, partial [Linum perenne]